MSDIFESLLQVLGAVGTAGAILLGLSTWLGNIWATRLLARQQVEYDKALHQATAKYDQYLELTKDAINRYSDAQFIRYGELWESLCDLRAAADDLWEGLPVTQERVTKFAEQVKCARTAIHKGALILTEKHYAGLLDVLASFDKFSIGKETLVELRRNPNSYAYDNYTVQDQIQRNEKDRQSYIQLLDQLRAHLKKQIGGVH